MTDLRFVTRARIERTEIYRRRIWISRCGAYRVSEFQRLLEGGRKVFYAERYCGGGCWDVLSRHRKRHAALQSCRRQNRSEQRERSVSVCGGE